MLDIIVKVLFIAAAFLVVVGLILTGVVLLIRKIVINSIANAVTTGMEIYNDFKKK